MGLNEFGRHAPGGPGEGLALALTQLDHQDSQNYWIGMEISLLFSCSCFLAVVRYRVEKVRGADMSPQLLSLKNKGITMWL